MKSTVHQNVMERADLPCPTPGSGRYTRYILERRLLVGLNVPVPEPDGAGVHVVSVQTTVHLLTERLQYL